MAPLALDFFFFFLFFFIYGCVGSSSLCEGFLQLRQAEATLHLSVRASHHRSLSRCGAQAPDAQAQQLWLTGPVAPWHVGSSQNRARTRVPCIGRQTPNHCATREAQLLTFEVMPSLIHMSWNTKKLNPLDETQKYFQNGRRQRCCRRCVGIKGDVAPRSDSSVHLSGSCYSCQSPASQCQSFCTVLEVD